MKLDKKEFKESIVSNLKKHFTKNLETATKRELFDAVSYSAMELVIEDWISTKETYEKKSVKQAYYLSAEFLMGRAFGNNLVNLGIMDDIKSVLNELGFNENEIEDMEFDAGLGNGGLGRLAACFLDSLATLELPGHGYGIRYRYGIFEQKIENGYQVEYPDKWLRYGDPWAIERKDKSVTVKFGGHIRVERDKDGREHFTVQGAEIINAIPYDYPVIGYGVKTVNRLRLWQAESPDDFDLQLFNEGQYLEAVRKSNVAKNISRVLYPNDNTNPGKELRLRQQYFFVSASIQDILNDYCAKYGDDFSKFPELVTLQLNDTHPVVAIPELMRIFLDEKKLEWEDAWAIVTKVCAFTNHTLMIEALEKWSVSLFSGLLPRIYQIVEEINRRFMVELNAKYPGDPGRQAKMSIISGGMINMAWLAIVGSYSVNGVAQLHTDLLRTIEMKEWDEFYPGKFNNKTNGVTQRRWLKKSNPELADLISSKIEDKWIVELTELKKIEKFVDDDKFVDEFMKIKKNNKIRVAKYIKDTMDIDIDTDSVFDIQVKRLHEYKRQLLNILHVMYLYNELKTNKKFDLYPRTFIFGAKAASGYHRAKLIIKLINSVADRINNDPEIKGKIKVVFLPNYRVSLAEMIIPSADISTQISTAGKEASGTGNMKFMMNGALTLGTMDGANIEIAEEAGEENEFIFGLNAEEVNELSQHHSYNPREIYDQDARLRTVVNQLIDGTYNDNGNEIFREIYDSLMYGVEGNPADQYFVMKDFEDYIRAHEDIDKSYRDKKAWAKKAIINVANSGKFSSDRTISQYAKEIWNIKKTTVK